MTQEDKELLLKDLCARLPYGVMVQDRNGIHILTLGNTELGTEHIKPCLRPLSSMTEEEYNSVDWEGCRHVVYYDENGFRFVKIDSFTIPVLDYLNARHFDFRYLIEKGLALEAPEEMYKTE